ncbi:MAG: hypothetical protein FWE14_03080 [Lachnospiraceae bacterium]|nr:hypothetical protein [Lachnospiraceae bacterium]
MQTSVFLFNLPMYLLICTAYFLVFVAVPFWLRGYRFRESNTAPKILSTLLFSNITVIFTVYILSALGIYYRFTLILTLLLICFAYRYVHNPSSRGALITSFLYHLKNIADSVELPRVMLKNFFVSLRTGIILIIKKIKNPPAFIITCVIFGYRIYLTSYHSLNNLFFGTSDMYVHTEWIKYMQRNDPFHGGVYPLGFHSIVISLADIFGFNPVTVVRMLGAIIGFLIFYSLYFLLRRTMRSYFAVNLVLFLFVVVEIFPNWATERHFLGLPQEYATIFLYPAAFYLWSYLREVRTLSKQGAITNASIFFESYDLVDIDGIKKKHRWFVMAYGSPKWYLVHFVVAVSLTLLIHPFVTIIALLFSAAIFISHLAYLNWAAFIRLAAAVVIGSVIALLPMGIGLLQGIPLHGSFAWATQVMAGSMGANYMAAVNEAAAAAEEFTPVTGFFEYIYWNLRWSGQFEKFGDLDLLWLIPALLIMILGIAFAFIPYKKRPHSEYFAAFSLNSLLLLILYILAYLRIFSLIEDSRLYSFFIYSLPLALAVLPELIHTLFYDDNGGKFIKLKKAVYLCIVVLVFAGGGSLIFKEYGFNRLQRVAMMQYNSSVKIYYQINSEFPRDSWVIVSSFVEYPQTLFEGYHYGMSDFIFDLEDPLADEPLKFDAENLFIFIVKRANLYGSRSSLVRLGEDVDLPVFDPVWAAVDLAVEAEGHNNYSIYSNLYLNGVLQAKAYAWVQAYQKIFPVEMTKYYEDDFLLVYRLHQNIYALNDLRLY